MKKTITKWFWTWDFDKEERWLNEMAAQGLALTGVGFGRYIFEESAPGEYIIRSELLEYLPSHPVSQQYIRFLEETGAEHVSSYMRWVYFRKKASEGGFDLFSDTASRQKHLRGITALLLVVTVMCASNTIWEFFLYFSNGSPALLAAALLILCFTLFLTQGLVRLLRKLRRLKKDQQLFE